jgi:hypothetical protein
VKPPVRWTRVVCGNCDRRAASVVVEERKKLHASLAAEGWRLTVGEATCPACSKVEDALAPRRAS